MEMASKILEAKAKEARERVAQAEAMLQTSKFSLEPVLREPVRGRDSLPESQSGRRAPHCGSGPEAADRGRPGARPPAAASGGVRARSVHEPAAGLAVRPRAVRCLEPATDRPEPVACSLRMPNDTAWTTDCKCCTHASVHQTSWRRLPLEGSI